MLNVKPLKQRNTVEPQTKRKKISRAIMVDEFETKTPALSDAAPHQTIGSNQKINYASSGIQPRLLKKLRTGKFTIENRLDLHGLNTEQARARISHFIQHCQLANNKCVLVIHGKGSSNKAPVLKSMVNHWLQQIPEVLAFCSALNKHGGNGAIYVLLKSNPHRDQ